MTRVFVRFSSLKTPPFEGGIGVLEDRVVDGEAEGCDSKRLVLVDHLGADRATPLVQVRRRPLEDPFAAVVPDARPVRVDEADVDLPSGPVDWINKGLEAAG